MAVFGSDPTSGFTMDPSFYGGDTSTPGGSGFTMDPSFYGGDAGNSSSGAMPGTGLPTSSVGSLGQDITSLLGLGTGVSPYAPGAPTDMSGPGTSLALFGKCTAKGTHLNKTAYYRKVMGVPVRIAKGTVCVKNRRKNAGNGHAAKRALHRIAMFDNLARKVESEMARVARRHHRPARASAAPRTARGHRTGCRCFACRR